MIDPLILETLCCPDTHERLVVADEKLVAQMNRQIATHTLSNRGGKQLTDPLEGGLVCAGGAWLYPVQEGIALLVSEEAISTKGALPLA